jgi:hypothetical protein
MPAALHHAAGVAGHDHERAIFLFTHFIANCQIHAVASRKKQVFLGIAAYGDLPSNGRGEKQMAGDFENKPKKKRIMIIRFSDRCVPSDFAAFAIRVVAEIGRHFAGFFLGVGLRLFQLCIDIKFKNVVVHVCSFASGT